MIDFANLTGSYFDSIATSYGLRNVRLRYGNTEIAPRPMLAHNGPTSGNELTFQNSDAEILDQWSATIPRDSLERSLGDAWESSIEPDQAWEILTPDTTVWKWYRTQGQPIFSNDASDRIQLVFVAGFTANNDLGFESPYIP